MGPRQDAISRRVIEKRRRAFEQAHHLNTFGKRQDQYNRELLIGILGRFGIKCTRKELRADLVRKLREHEQFLIAEGEDAIGEADAFVKDFVPGASYPRIQCTVCMEYRRSYEFPQHKISNECQHPVEVCNDCLEGHIANYVAEYIAAAADAEKEMPTLQCPLCNEELNAGHIREFGRPEDSESFDTAAAEFMLRNHPNYRTCCQPNCEAGQLHFGNHRRMICKTCRGSSCVFHEVPWHEGETCSQYDRSCTDEVRAKQLAEQEAKSRRWIEKNTRPCPRCKAAIQKNNGCDHMRCLCRQDFSWQRARRR